MNKRLWRALKAILCTYGTPQPVHTFATDIKSLAGLKQVPSMAFVGPLTMRLKNNDSVLGTYRSKKMNKIVDTMQSLTAMLSNAAPNNSASRPK